MPSASSFTTHPPPAYEIEYAYPNLPNDNDQLSPDPQEVHTLYVYGDRTFVPTLGKMHRHLPTVESSDGIQATMGYKGSNPLGSNAGKAARSTSGKKERSESTGTVSSKDSLNSSTCTVADVVKKYWTHVKKNSR